MPSDVTTARARLDDELHRKAEQPVDAFADDDVVEVDAVELRERRAQLVALGIGIHPVAVGGGAHGGQRFGRRPKQAFVGAEAGAERPAARALLRLGADERHERGQAFDQCGEARA